jgi:hypothetical protein
MLHAIFASQFAESAERQQETWLRSTVHRNLELDVNSATACRCSMPVLIMTLQLAMLLAGEHIIIAADD